MKIEILNESGYKEALYGLGLSHGITSNIKFENFNPLLDEYRKMESVAFRLKDKDKGHNKFLRQIWVWAKITASRGWWQEEATYMAGGSVRQSESTMHTIGKKLLTNKDFLLPVGITMLGLINSRIQTYNQTKKTEDLETLKNILPEGFLQTRVVCYNYQTIRTMAIQRRKHRLLEWREFCLFMKENLQHKELLSDIFE